MSTPHGNMICDFCLGNSAEEVRRLICSHTCCSLCISQLTEKSEDIQCPQCRITSKVACADLLEKARPEAEVLDEFVNTICGNCQEKAEKFCVHCQLMLCKNHIQEDKRTARADRKPQHHHVLMEDFLLDMEHYLKHFCKQHKDKETSKACYKCLQVFCDACNMEQGCKDGRHTIKSIKKVSKITQARLDELLNSVSEKITQLSKFEKDLIAAIKQVNDLAVELQEDVDPVVNEQIKFISQEGERIKDEIKQFANEYNTQLHLKSKQKKSSDEQAVSYLSKLKELKQMTSPGRILERFSSIECGLSELLKESMNPVCIPKAFVTKEPGHRISLGLELVLIHQYNNQESKGEMAGAFMVACDPSFPPLCDDQVYTLRDTSDGQSKPASSSAAGNNSSCDDHKKAYKSSIDKRNFALTIGEVTVKVYQGDITTVSCPAIVNAAINDLVHKGGVAGAIMAASDRSFQKESLDHVRKLGRPLCDGEVFAQRSTGRLEASGISFVINAVGPMYSNYRNDVAGCENNLNEAIYESIKEADRNECYSIAIPAVSSGIFGVPIHICTAAYWKAVLKFVGEETHSLKEIHFVNIDFQTAQAVSNAFKKFSGGNMAVGKGPSNFQTAGVELVGCKNARRTSDGTDDNRTKNFNVPRENVDYRYYPDTLEAGENPNLTGVKRKINNKNGENYQAQAGTYAAVARSGLHVDIGQKQMEMDSMEECNICAVGKPSIDFINLPCNHRMCRPCLAALQSVTKTNLCPTCRAPFTTPSGPQPKGGHMRVKTQAWGVPGYEKYGTIVIEYRIPDGMQTEEHPNPGKPFYGTTRTAYLPDTEEGQRVCRMLRKAFYSGLIFTVGRSLSSGSDNSVVWNDIHHKTSTNGTYGYPDSNYLASVEADLRARGITDP